MTDPRITYVPHDTTTREAELSTLCNIYRFLLLKKGDLYALTTDSITDTAKNGAQTTERE